MKKKKRNPVYLSLIKICAFTLVTAGIIILVITLVVNIQKKYSSISNNDIDKNVEVETGQLAVKINSILYFKNDNSEAEANIENNKKNLYDMIIKIYDENNNIIYESLKLSPGQKIEKIKLDKKLSVGKHNAIAYFEAYSEGNYVGKTGTKIVINIEG